MALHLVERKICSVSEPFVVVVVVVVVALSVINANANANANLDESLVDLSAYLLCSALPVSGYIHTSIPYSAPHLVAWVVPTVVC